MIFSIRFSQYDYNAILQVSNRLVTEAEKFTRITSNIETDFLVIYKKKKRFAILCPVIQN